MADAEEVGRIYLNSNWEPVEEGSVYAVHVLAPGDTVVDAAGRQLYPPLGDEEAAPAQDVSDGEQAEEAPQEPDPDARSLKSVKPKGGK